KAFFNEDFVIPSPVVPNAAGTALVAYTGGSLTLGGEINKIAANIAYGRNMAGVHYRCDAQDSLKLGEAVAISILEDLAYLIHIDFKGFSLTKFDGTKITIGAKKNINLLG
ncbi:MAG: phosphoesterase PA-phosphatase related protein, partial [uncultured bacterium]